MQTLGARDPAQVIQAAFRQPRKFAAVGFKLFYYQPVDRGYEETWNIVLRDPDLRVIHLKRRNILRSLVSRRIAVETGHWASYERGMQNPPAKRVTISVEEVRAGLENTRNMVGHGDLLFRGRRMMTIDYEDLVSSPERHLRELTRFLGVDDVATELTGRLERQNPEPLSLLLDNHEELRRAFAETEWAWMFDE